MEWWQVMSDHPRLEIRRNVHEVRYYRNQAFKATFPDATLDPQQDTLTWEPNLTAAANEDRCFLSRRIEKQFVSIHLF